jgi:hypothetical protein
MVLITHGQFDGNFPKLYIFLYFELFGRGHGRLATLNSPGPNAHRALHEPQAGPAGQVPRAQEVLEGFLEAAAEGRAPGEQVGGERERGTVPLGQLQDVGFQNNQPVSNFLLQKGLVYSV